MSKKIFHANKFKLTKFKLTLLLLLFLGMVNPASKIMASDNFDLETKTFLTRFFKNPSKVMSERIVKRNINAEIVPKLILTKEQKSKLSRIRYAFRNRLLKKFNQNNKNKDVSQFFNIRSAYLENDLADNIVYNRTTMIKNIFDIDKAGLTKATLETQPWSDDYWPIYKGGLGFRYADPNAEIVEDALTDLWDRILNRDSSWKKYYQYVLKNPAQNYIEKGTINMLSPAEKYDLLIGDEEFSLSKAMWKEGEKYYNEKFKVETWMGICHGWAAASYMSPRPLHSVIVNSLNNKYKITFYPSDIKALSSLFWANSNYPQYLAGGRCSIKDKDKEVKRDATSGRILNPECFDTNPGTWHMTVVNQLGLAKKSFIIDSIYDYEVWNQPMLSYEYTYFNPQTSENFSDAKSAIILLKDFTKDKFTNFRSKDAKYAVGVKMTITYLAETDPSQLDDNPTLDSLVTAKYYYDLELDETGKILGGEWYADSHPDFLWTPAPGAKPYMTLDKMISNKWNPITEALPANWAEYAKKAVKFKLPLGRIVYALTAASRGEENYFESEMF
ncbi:MAG: hypothetical protein HQK51_02040 [Oligoflexia bacterium]|nr:hypothetical protein [Oligoflexia bacterium]